MSQQRVSPAMARTGGPSEKFMQQLVEHATEIVPPTNLGKRRKVRSELGCGKVTLNINSSLKKRMRAAARGVGAYGK